MHDISDEMRYGDRFPDSFLNESGNLYVDKTLLIDKTNAVINTRQKFICVSRPRRFGKSMAEDMLTSV